MQGIFNPMGSHFVLDCYATLKKEILFLLWRLCLSGKKFLEAIVVHPIKMPEMMYNPKLRLIIKISTNVLQTMKGKKQKELYT